MATNVLLPQWGMNMQDGKLVRWLVQEGATVKAGDPLVEVETAKINSELESPASGVVARILAPEGATVAVGTVVAVIAAPGETVPPSPSATPPIAGAPPWTAPPPQAPLHSVESTQPRLAAASVQVVPAARLLARRHGVDLAQVQGTGPGGRVLEADVQRLIQVRAAPPGQASGPDSGQAMPLTGLRKIIADRMLRSVQTMAQLTLTTEADVTELVRLREELIARWRPHHLRPLDLDLIVKATAHALKEHPRLNATLEGDSLRLREEVNIGVAMAVPQGIMVPVVHRADEKGLLVVAQELRELMRRAREGGLKLEHLGGASFTITSLASYEVDSFTPLIDPPQVAILGVGRVVEKAAVYQREIVARWMMALSLTFDHRALDGAPAGEFLRALKRRLESPRWMAAEEGA